MKALTLGLFLIAVSAQWSFAQNYSADQEIIHLSKQKWQCIADKNVDSLAALFHEKAELVHMAGNWGTDRERQLIESGGIGYKQAELQAVTVQQIENTAILLNRFT